MNGAVSESNAYYDNNSQKHACISFNGSRIDDFFARRLQRSAALRLQIALKRAIDIVLSVVLLFITGPLILCGALATIVTSPGGPLFLGQRCGAADRVFRCVKLRTMRIDQDAVLARRGLTDRGSDGRLLLHHDDPRITAVGSLLRKTSIDELPQLWNVLCGDMSLVGPRPLAIYMLEEFPEIRATRGIVRPGITGLWQIRKRMKNASVLDMIDDDVEYIAKLNLLLDARILIATLPRLLEPATHPDR